MKNALLPRRILAYLIDSLIVFCIFVMLLQFMVFVPLRGSIFSSDEWFRSGWHTEIYTLLTISVPVWLYFSLFEASNLVATPGKRLLRLQTLSIAGNGRLSFGQSLLRTVIKLRPWEIAHFTNNYPIPMWYATNPGLRAGFILVPLLILIYLAVTQFSPRKQGPHDLAARTIVELSK